MEAIRPVQVRTSSANEANNLPLPPQSTPIHVPSREEHNPEMSSLDILYQEWDEIMDGTTAAPSAIQSQAADLNASIDLNASYEDAMSFLESLEAEGGLYETFEGKEPQFAPTTSNDLSGIPETEVIGASLPSTPLASVIQNEQIVTNNTLLQDYPPLTNNDVSNSKATAKLTVNPLSKLYSLEATTLSSQSGMGEYPSLDLDLPYTPSAAASVMQVQLHASEPKPDMKPINTVSIASANYVHPHSSKPVPATYPPIPMPLQAPVISHISTEKQEQALARQYEALRQRNQELLLQQQQQQQQVTASRLKVPGHVWGPASSMPPPAQQMQQHAPPVYQMQEQAPPLHQMQEQAHQMQQHAPPVVTDPTIKYICCGGCRAWLRAPVTAKMILCPSCRSMNNCANISSATETNTNNSNSDSTRTAASEPLAVWTELGSNLLALIPTLFRDCFEGASRGVGAITDYAVNLAGTGNSIFNDTTNNSVSTIQSGYNNSSYPGMQAYASNQISGTEIQLRDILPTAPPTPMLDRSAEVMRPLTGLGSGMGHNQPWGRRMQMQSIPNPQTGPAVGYAALNTSDE